MRQSIPLSDAAVEFIHQQQGQYIAGQWVKSLSGFDIPIVEPSTESIVGHVHEADINNIHSAVASSIQAFHADSPWRAYSPAQREQLLQALADAVEKDAPLLAELITLELGAPLTAAKEFEIAKTVETLRYYAGAASKIHGEVIDVTTGIHDPDYFGYTCHEPVGVVAAIVPWNAPLLIAIWKLAPALAAGCTVILKPSEEASLVILRLAELLHQIGCPPGVVNVIVGRGHTVGRALASHPGIDKVTFTGSMAAGKDIHRQASNRLTRLSLELGGKSPVIVMSDADLAKAVPGVVMGAFANAGQVCVAGSRVFVHKDIADTFIQQVKAMVSTLVVGSGFNADTIIGPVISEKQQRTINEYIDHAFESGARIHQTTLSVTQGFFVAPTVITHLPADSTLLTEEIFGPVMTIETFDNEDDIIQQTNDACYGLAAMVWSESYRHIQRITQRLRVGSVFINTPAFPPPAMPTGGFRESGIGRDLGKTGLEGYLETKSVIADFSL